ncbi:hypothetical protein L227DRAFT_571458 [Lentinus tigrinus ALCF2SS1-6]|uniref:Uncharacterized protein n=1 Tax=Lentinus tigrinus ALCF2SS1-6 TaxID=1328759 RepID=A0A5C2SPI4_9APHY|nr:hypothetical protein L227DRAFT_571458 [Lentinus tigrinus ALCF2SS1-6]
MLELVHAAVRILLIAAAGMVLALVGIVVVRNLWYLNMQESMTVRCRASLHT